MKHNWQDEFNKMLSNDLQLKAVSELLSSLRDAEITQEEVRGYLNSIRSTSDEVDEDRILEILDVVEGHCNPQYRVW